MTTGPDTADGFDCLVLPFTIVVGNPWHAPADGMSRLEPILVHPANGWPNRWVHPVKSPPFTLAELLGIPSARAQGIPPEEEEIVRRSPGGRSLTLAEEFRLELYNRATRRLIELEPDNPELPGISGPDYIPDEANLKRRQEATAWAEIRAKRAADLLAGRRQRDVADFVAQGGKPIGYQLKIGRSYSAGYVRTVTPAEFAALKVDLEKLGYVRDLKSRYEGERYVGPGGMACGYRTDSRGTETIDVQSPALKESFRIHQR